MIAPELLTSIEEIRLVPPDLERDPPLSTEWLAGESGRLTQQSMGIPDKDIQEEPTLEGEEERIRMMMESDHHIVWMIDLDGDIVGAVEAELNPTKYLDAPSVHVMIGDTAARGRGVATAALRSVIDWLQSTHEDIFIFTRYLVNNEASAQLLLKVGFEQDGEPYIDDEGLKWQNVILRDDAY